MLQFNEHLIDISPNLAITEMNAAGLR